MKKILLFAGFTIISYCLQAQISGCTDPLATNYNPAATKNDGSCIYESANISPVKSWNFPQIINETSGLVYWNQKFWTHNDDTDTNIYSFDTLDINTYTKHPLPHVQNYDWEEISQDSLYFYMGDFGNNTNGNRKDLKILRIEKNSLLANHPLIDTIHFSYSLQTDFTSTGSNNTDFDCEAFIVTNDSIYLFTKEWVSLNSSIYSLPKIPGTYTANFQSKHNVNGLITGATYLASKNLVVLCGYGKFLGPFFYLLYDFEFPYFFSGNKRKIGTNWTFYQIEGITTEDGLNYYTTNEEFTVPLIGNTINAQFHKFDLSPYLSNFLNASSENSIENISKNITLSHNPANSYLNIGIDHSLIGEKFYIVNAYGDTVMTGKLKEIKSQIDISKLHPGAYWIVLKNKRATVKFMKE